MLVLKLKDGNSKLHKTVGTWSILASQEVCGRVCTGCYAIKGQNFRPVVKDYNTRMYEASKLDSFVEDLVVHKKYRYVRVHASGEFYSQEYINKWEQIAKKYPDITFYAYTKRLEEFDFSNLKKLQNFVLHSSLYDGEVNYGKHIGNIATSKSGFVCPDTLTKNPDGFCGSGCDWCMQKYNEGTPIFFEKH